MATLLPLNTPVPVRFVENFNCLDQDVKEIHAPKIETAWCLLELPAEQLAALEAGASFYFQAREGGKGTHDGGAALCTDNATFSVEFLENSNSQFIATIGEVPVAVATHVVAAEAAEPKTDAAESKEVLGESTEPKEPKEGVSSGASDTTAPAAAEASDTTAPAAAEAKPPTTSLLAEVFAQCRGQMIVKSARVNTLRLQELLAKQALSSERRTEAGEPETQLLSAEELAYQVAASPGELQEMLNAGPYVQVDGFWRLLPSRLEHEIIDATASLVTANSWKAEDIDPEQLLRAVQEHVGQHAVPTLAVLRKALLKVIKLAAPATEAEKDASPSAEQAAAPPAEAAAQAAAQADTGGDKAGSPAAEISSSQNFALDKNRLDRFQIVQLLRQPPAQVRDRFGLPPPEPRAKRPRQDLKASRGGDGLQLKEFAAAVQAITGAEEKPNREGIVELLGEAAYVDEFEGTVHNLPVSMLPPSALPRLRGLLELTSHWRPERLSDLLTPVLPVGTKVAAWLLKNTRAVHVEFEAGKEERMLTKKFF